MRSVIILLIAALLAACSSSQLERTSASLPTVTYQPQTEQDYQRAAEAADDYCDDKYDAEAEASQLWPTSRGEVTFTCVPD
jgi:hypothetical protein